MQVKIYSEKETRIFKGDINFETLQNYCAQNFKAAQISNQLSFTYPSNPQENQEIIKVDSQKQLEKALKQNGAEKSLKLNLIIEEIQAEKQDSQENISQSQEKEENKQNSENEQKNEEEEENSEKNSENSENSENSDKMKEIRQKFKEAKKEKRKQRKQRLINYCRKDEFMSQFVQKCQKFVKTRIIPKLNKFEKEYIIFFLVKYFIMFAYKLALIVKTLIKKKKEKFGKKFGKKNCHKKMFKFAQNPFFKQIINDNSDFKEIFSQISQKFEQKQEKQESQEQNQEQQGQSENKEQKQEQEKFEKQVPHEIFQKFDKIAQIFKNKLQTQNLFQQTNQQQQQENQEQKKNEDQFQLRAQRIKEIIAKEEIDYLQVVKENKDMTDEQLIEKLLLV
ncbi:hypothetical protein PPERSA_06056 [Pseudocohnilembus persalinus]|uniref:PB1 domain-containing protein n=1 Tax=Pseudocohnilembus persalinus TaxID=266149 RepID=A0A0V0QVE1_PSEPJ|nr:hypothetical protein PPERSA_06056 [Pseudocohnilembus persalinus]|eukprot:KRX06174.1 hypothetical protein PPERSA_06056 [Pseudocohnilembus persalinus]